MRSIRHEPLLLVERSVQPVKQAVERLRQLSQLIFRVLHRKAFVQVFRSHLSGLRTHCRNRRKASSSKKISAGTCEQNREWNHKRERSRQGFQKFFLRMQGLENFFCE